MRSYIFFRKKFCQDLSCSTVGRREGELIECLKFRIFFLFDSHQSENQLFNTPEIAKLETSHQLCSCAKAFESIGCTGK